MTLPAATRKKYGLKKGDLVAVEDTDGGVVIKPVSIAERGAGSTWLAELYELFGPVREEASGSTESEINETVDAAVKTARRARA